MPLTPDLFCSKCGSRRPDDLTFCGSCGEKFASFKQPRSKPDFAGKTRTLSNGGIVGISALIGVVLFVITVFLVGVTANSSRRSDTALLSPQTTESALVPASDPVTERKESVTSTSDSDSDSADNSPLPEHRQPPENRQPGSPANETRSEIPAGAIIGNKSSRVYHREGCPNYADVAARNRRLFSSADEAEQAGFRAAGNCGGAAPPVGNGSAVADERTSPVGETDLSVGSEPTPKSKEKPKERKPKVAKPSGASAECRDGSLSYSRSRRGTCSHHGGVAVWY